MNTATFQDSQCSDSLKSSLYREQDIIESINVLLGRIRSSQQSSFGASQQNFNIANESQLINPLKNTSDGLITEEKRMQNLEFTPITRSEYSMESYKSNQEYQSEQTQQVNKAQPKIDKSNSDNEEMRMMMIKLDKKVDYLIQMRQNDLETIGVLKDNLISMNQLLRQKEQQFAELQQEFLVLRRQQNQNQSINLNQQDYPMKESCLQRLNSSNIRLQLENITELRGKENNQNQNNSRPKEKEQNSQKSLDVLDEFRNICFKRKN